jgi:hypothetical protein
MTQDFYSDHAPVQEPEETLRLVARLPPPTGLADRVHSRLERIPAAPHRSFWTLWMPVQRLQLAGAALLVLAIAGSTWTVRHARSGHAQVVQPAAQGPAFGSAGAERHPSSLTPIKAPPPAPRKKPSASRMKHVPKAAAASSAAEDSTTP